MEVLFGIWLVVGIIFAAIMFVGGCLYTAFYVSERKSNSSRENAEAANSVLTMWKLFLSAPVWPLTLIWFAYRTYQKIKVDLADV